MIKHWKISLLISAICYIGFPRYMDYLTSVNRGDPLGLWALPWIMPTLVVTFIVGPFTLVMGAIGGLRALKTTPKKLNFILLPVLIFILLIVFTVWSRLLPKF